MGNLRVLLDTCSFLWLGTEPSRFSGRVIEAINGPSTQLLFSDVSLWEICLKWKAGKLKLPSPPRIWCEEQARIWKLLRLEINRPHLYRVTELPPLHRDPFDRLLVAQCLEEECRILTPDHHISQYPVGTLW